MYVINYFNKKQQEYLSSTNPLQLAKDWDGNVPLFLHIKAKIPAFGGMQEHFRKIVNNLGLEVVDRRTNRNGRGLDATVQTDLFVRDTTINMKLQKIAAQRKIKRALEKALKSTSGNSSTLSAMRKSFSRGSIRLSSSNLSELDVANLEEEVHGALQEAAKIEDEIIIRGKLIEAKIAEAMAVKIEVVVDL